MLKDARHSYFVRVNIYIVAIILSFNFELYL